MIEDYALNSKNAGLKQFLKGSVPVTGNGTKAETTVMHNLGYTPHFLAFIRKGSENKWYPIGHDIYAADDRYDGIAKTNGLLLRIKPAPNGQAYTLYYIIFVDKVE